MRRKMRRIRAKAMRALIIHDNSELQFQLESSLAKAGYQVFLASGRRDGLPLMYEARPDVIFLGMGQDRQELWETFSCIRLFTDTPMVVLVDEVPATAGGAAEERNTMILPASTPGSRIVAQVQAFEELQAASTATAPGAAEKQEPVVPLDLLNAEEVLSIDAALSEINGLGEVRLTFSEGRVQRLEKLKTEVVEAGSPDNEKENG